MERAAMLETWLKCHACPPLASSSELSRCLKYPFLIVIIITVSEHSQEPYSMALFPTLWVGTET